MTASLEIGSCSMCVNHCRLRAFAGVELENIKPAESERPPDSVSDDPFEQATIAAMQQAHDNARRDALETVRMQIFTFAMDADEKDCPNVQEVLQDTGIVE